MRLAVLAAFVLVMFSPAAALAQQNVKVAVTSASEQPKPGATTDLVIRFEPRAGWHGYWANPGDAGGRAVFRWKTPKGVSVGEPLWSAPIELKTLGLTSYVMDGAYSLIFPMKVASSISAGTALPVSVEMTLFLCTDGLCSAQAVTGAVDLVAGDGSPSRVGARMVRNARDELPTPIRSVSASKSGDRVTIGFGGGQVPPGAKLYLANERAPVVEEGLLERNGRLEAQVAWSDAPGTVSGTLVAGSRSWSFSKVEIAAEPLQIPTPEPETDVGTDAGGEEAGKETDVPSVIEQDLQNDPVSSTVVESDESEVSAADVPREKETGLSALQALIALVALFVLTGMAGILRSRIVDQKMNRQAR